MTVARDWTAVAWDIDGTLIDSEPLHLEALVAVSARYGLDLARDSDDRFRGVHMEDVWRALRPHYPASLTEEAWNAEIVDYFCDHADRLVPTPDAIATVRTLAEQGIAQVCVSNSTRRIVDVNIERLGIASLLAGTVSFSDVTRGKPDPEPYRRGVDLLKTPPGQVLAVEDSVTGIAAAKAAGLQTAGFDPSGRPVPNADFSLRRLGALVV